MDRSIMKAGRLPGLLIGLGGLVGIVLTALLTVLPAARAHASVQTYTANYVWDAQRRLTYTIAPDSGSGIRVATHYIYDADDQLIETDKGTTTLLGTDFSAISTNFVPLETTTAVYDTVGNKVQSNVLNGAAGSAQLIVTQMAYDADDRPQCTAVRENPAVFASLPGACAQSTAGANGPDHITQIVYDAAGQKLQELRGVGSAIQITYGIFSYSNNGQVATLKDANGNLTTNTYDGFNRLSQVNFPSTTRGAGTSNATDLESYGYDANGNRTSLRKRDASVINYVYDALNRQTQKSFPANAANTVNYAYDLLSRRLSALYPNQSNAGVTWAYDNAGRRTSEATNGRAVTFTYDKAANRATMAYPDGQSLTYTFDAANQFDNVAAAAGAVNVALSFDGLGRLTTINRGGAVTTVGTGGVGGYDPADRMLNLTHAFTPTAANVAYAFGYTPASQVASAATTNPAYDWAGASAQTINTTADGLNRDAAIAAVGGPCAASGAGYDCNGNLTFDGTRHFTYDGENRLITETGPVTLNLAYDPLGRLQQTIVNGVTTQFLYDGDALVAEYNGSNTLLRRYVHGPGVDNPLIWFEGAGVAAANASYLIADRQGSIIATTNSTGGVTNTYTYDPYGVPNAWGGSRFRYTGQIEIPEAQLYYYKARVYDPASGRFLQTDPVGYKDDLDLYAYVGEDPVNKSDPTGEISDADWVDIGGYVVQGGADLLAGGEVAASDGAALAGPAEATVAEGNAIGEAAHATAAEMRIASRQAMREQGVPTSRPRSDVKATGGRPVPQPRRQQTTTDGNGDPVVVSNHEPHPNGSQPHDQSPHVHVAPPKGTTRPDGSVPYRNGGTVVPVKPPPPAPGSQ